MNTYASKDDLKNAFLENNDMSSRQLFVELEKVVFGSNNIEQYLDSLLVGGAGDEILTKVREKMKELGSQKDGNVGIIDRYPFLEGKIKTLLFNDVNIPVEWDIGADKTGNTSIYIYLNGSWMNRCNSGDELSVFETKAIRFGHRLKNIKHA